MVTNSSSQIPTAATGTLLAGQGVGTASAFTATPTVTSISFGGSTLSTYTTGGTWTPTIVGGTVAGTTTYSTQTGTYSRIGNIVTIQATLSISAATGTGNANIGGFPFNPTNPAQGVVYFDGSGWAWPAGRTSLSLFINTSGVGTLQVSGTSVGIMGIQMTNSALQLFFTCTYLV